VNVVHEWNGGAVKAEPNLKQNTHKLGRIKGDELNEPLWSGPVNVNGMGYDG